MSIGPQGNLTRAISAQTALRPATTRTSDSTEEKVDTENSTGDGNKEEKLSRFDAVKRGEAVQATDPKSLEQRYGLSPAPGFYNQEGGQSSQAANSTGANQSPYNPGIQSMPGISMTQINNRPDPWQGNPGAQLPPPQAPATRSFVGIVGGTNGSIAGQLAMVESPNGSLTGTYKNATGHYIDVTGVNQHGNFNLPLPDGTRIHGLVNEKTHSIDLAHIDRANEHMDPVTTELPHQEPPRIEPDWARQDPLTV